MNTTERIVMHCAKCGAQNPIVAKACHTCGSQLHLPQKSETATQEAPAIAWQGNASQAARQVGSHYKWRWICGWCMTLAGVFVLLAGLADFWPGRDTIPYAVFPMSDPMIWMISAIVLGLLFTATGIATLRRNAKNHPSL